ncbi:Endopolyphosphatase Ppn1p-related protein [Penicillium cf. griseofulvum]|uniref:Endopolyphosphatase n=1 Tax=Penicillium cf. griseofulvum TaxID=2972120 RepID=A0A9W9IW77_9EURO|nr:Endopolyphosphatase Ppn1p-related protein [Penicillium cf. griseofulvum]KAJ5429699.1 Endopolyphosphatase Ppn1p-related protein [Penicillium cf. griseofulvum]KAJ5436534.1 Endopolyphosphatase Ppn1p-related protein [Penicillium cf. griseofulvum]
MQSIFLLLGLFADAISASPLEQQPLGHISTGLAEGWRKPVRGRFLHITDFHPDRLYKPGTSIDRSCHHGKGSAGYFGAEGTDCDSPLSLVNETFRWIEENLKDEIDFVIWTGDSARHDNDEKLPRTADEIMELNAFLSQQWINIFGAEEVLGTSNAVPRMSIPVIPTFGNNDIMPHNIFNEGPNKWTKRFAEIWDQFIPEDQRHTFVEGGWFTTEVVPGRLAVISLNTMYFFDSNSAVDGCNAKSEPGYEHMEWLRVQLKILRSRNMKAILMGHVPPARSSEKKNWDDTCWQKYTLWMHQYRDVVVGSFYGHMNIDHFMLQDSNKVNIDSKADGKVSTRSKTDYLESLRNQWSSLPSPPSGTFEELDSASNIGDLSQVKPAKDKRGKKKDKKKQKFLDKIGGPWAERYSVSLVAPSLVPNFFPSLRVVDYNITGLNDVAHGVDLFIREVDDATFGHDNDAIDTLELSDNYLMTPEIQKKKKNKDKKKKPKFKVPEPPSSTAPPGPAYSNQAFTLLGYTQYYSNLTKLHEQIAAGERGKNPRVDYEIEYTTNDDVYRMKDLTVRSFFQLAARIADDGEEKQTDNFKDPETESKKKKKKPNDIWRAFLRRAFVGFEVYDLDE